MKRIITVFVALGIIATLSVGTAAAQPANHTKFKLPEGSKQLPDGGYSLGVRKDPASGKDVEGIAYLHPRKDTASANGTPKPTGTVCYAVMAKGARWKIAEPWVLDPTNTRGLTSDFLLSHTSANIGKWESAANFNIFGNGTLTSGLSIDEFTPDGNNEILFGSIEDPGIIAVTISWGFYDGPSAKREIVEWGQIFDEQDFDWSATGEAAKMDYDNISVHELGHAAGMGHPSDSCTEESMYSYASNGETKKSTLNAGDIAGIRSLY